MGSIGQVIAALYVALGEAGGPEAMRAANRVLRDAIADQVIDDPVAIGVLLSLAQDEGEADVPLTILISKQSSIERQTNESI
jgi:hypothetical protein